MYMHCVLSVGVSDDLLRACAWRAKQFAAVFREMQHRWIEVDRRAESEGKKSSVVHRQARPTVSGGYLRRWKGSLFYLINELNSTGRTLTNHPYIHTNSQTKC